MSAPSHDAASPAAQLLTPVSVNRAPDRPLKLRCAAAVLLVLSAGSALAQEALQPRLDAVEEQLLRLQLTLADTDKLRDGAEFRRLLADARFAAMALPETSAEAGSLQQRLLGDFDRIRRNLAVRRPDRPTPAPAVATSRDLVGSLLLETRRVRLATEPSEPSFSDRANSWLQSTGLMTSPVADWGRFLRSEWQALSNAQRLSLGGALGLLTALIWLRRRRPLKENHQWLDDLPDAIAMFDEKGRLRAMNNKLLKLLPMEMSQAALTNATSSDLYAQLSPDNVAIERARNRAREDAADLDATLSFEVPSYGRHALLVKERTTREGGTAVSVTGGYASTGSRLSDPLTALPNRTRLLAELTQRCIKTTDKLALMIVDLRSFRQINDSYGRKAGDELLKQTAICLQHCMPADALIARTAGDEFAVLIEFDGQVQSVEAPVTAFLNTLRQGLTVHGMSVPVRASVGIAYAPDHGNTVSSLLRCADSACAHAKRRGNNSLVIYNSSQQQHAKRQHQLEVGLQQAVEREELTLQYQPQIDVRSKMTCGMEALVRWKSREFGNVSPAEFIPIAEQTGIITQLGTWVLENAINDYGRLAQFGMSPATLSVNLSRKQFENGRIVHDVADVLESTGFDPASLCLEITETALFSDAQVLRKILNDLHGLGAKLAIDDFGVGYSSLLELRDLPISEVKIDRAFVVDVATNSNSQDIIQAVVSIARSIGADVVAEGIEDQQQFDTIAALGCDRAQGYYLCEPMPATTFPDVVLSA